MDYQSLLRSKCKEIMKHPIVKHFLSNPQHYRLFKNVMESPNEKDARSLDELFKQFYKEIRIVKYMNSMIRIFSIDFDKRVRKNQKRYPLTVDHPEAAPCPACSGKGVILTAQGYTLLDFIQKHLNK